MELLSSHLFLCLVFSLQPQDSIGDVEVRISPDSTSFVVQFQILSSLPATKEGSDIKPVVKERMNE